MVSNKNTGGIVSISIVTAGRLQQFEYSFTGIYLLVLKKHSDIENLKINTKQLISWLFR
jgi:hypothetical protein